MNEKVLFYIAVFFLIIIPLLSPVSAVDFSVDCPAPPASCRKMGIEPLFNSNSDGFWYPGKTVRRSVNLKNSSPDLRQWVMKGARSSHSNPLETVITLSVVDVGSSLNIWSGTIGGLYNLEKVDLGTFNPNTSKDFNFTMTMADTAGDSYQGQETVFDLSLGFWEENIATPTPTETPGPTSTPVPGPTSTPGPGPTSTPAPASPSQGGPAGAVAGAAISAGGLVGQILKPAETLVSNILGAQAGTASGISTSAGKLAGGIGCRNSWWWMIVLILETAITAVLVYYGRKKESLKYLLAQGAVALSSIIITGALFCQWWRLVVSGLIGVAGIISLLL